MYIYLLNIYVYIYMVNINIIYIYIYGEYTYLLYGASVRYCVPLSRRERRAS